MEKVSTIIKRNRILIFFSIFAVLIIVGIIGGIYTAKKENSKSYNFVVSKRYRAANGLMTFYDKEKEIKIYSYYLSDTICPGDSIAKEKYAKYLKVYRKNFEEKYELFLTLRRKQDFDMFLERK